MEKVQLQSELNSCTKALLAVEQRIISYCKRIKRSPCRMDEFVGQIQRQGGRVLQRQDTFELIS